MYGRGRRRPRFSLLQLDYNESFFIDLGCILDVEEPAGQKLGLRGARRLKGRLKVGSWSLTFDPEDPETPLLRLPMREMPQPADAWDGDPDGGEGLEVPASLGYRRATADEPIEAVRLEEEGGGGGGCRLRFALLHTPLSLVLPLVPLYGSWRDMLVLAEELLELEGERERPERAILVDAICACFAAQMQKDSESLDDRSELLGSEVFGSVAGVASVAGTGWLWLCGWLAMCGHRAPAVPWCSDLHFNLRACKN